MLRRKIFVALQQFPLFQNLDSAESFKSLF